MEDFKLKFIANFITDNRWKYFTNGLGTTYVVSFFAVILGVVIGVLIAVVRSSADKLDRPPLVVKILNVICKLYLTVIRGTPAMIQLLIMYYIVFGSVDVSKRLVAILTFGINSGAYVAEIIRSGIQSIDGGQTEAARSLGLSQAQNLRYIILPQALKNILPAIANEFVVIIKESAITYTIGVQDIMSAVNAVKGATFVIIEPLLVATAIYFCLCFPTSKLIAYFERRMSRGDKR